MDRGSRTSEMVDLIHLQQQRLHDVVPDELESRVPKVVHDVLLPSSKEIVHHDNTVPSGNQPIHQVRTYETRATCHDDPESFPFNPQRNLPHRMHPRRDAVVVRRKLGLALEVRDRERLVGDGGRGGGRGGDECEEDGGDEDSEEDEEESLLTEHVVNRASDGEPGFVGLWRVGVVDGLGLMPSENEFGAHSWFVLNEL
ncbi:hypothetical protein V8G54_028590 [Vigna mungo]|uniref:Uncharacterized protein n=1 Tax=Vigna mungo TaxID=3915 RepID=A0AAQ3MT89_VIGMU